MRPLGAEDLEALPKLVEDADQLLGLLGLSAVHEAPADTAE
ncbi:MAG: hypothetical protein AAF950_08780 [Pseudomonadota bacterium]